MQASTPLFETPWKNGREREICCVEGRKNHKSDTAPKCSPTVHRRQDSSRIRRRRYPNQNNSPSKSELVAHRHRSMHQIKVVLGESNLFRRFAHTATLHDLLNIGMGLQQTGGRKQHPLAETN
ncbi:hypothetical protein L1049_014179 [Liquidambar formosana]|uniref:Uncharacterized protein n=1 Tax=Liquidambar formosana TaxID=63359 RepID=A0AAP0RQ19_LIQFO